MPQAQHAAEAGRPELAQELPADPRARAETRARAAETVAAFAQTSALQALDGVLAADSPPAARMTADAAHASARLLDGEVARFRALADQNA